MLPLMPFRLGKLAPRVDSRTLKLQAYLRQRALPSPPSAVDWTAKISSWPMMANDTIGDCTCAAAGHMIECWTANLGDAFTPTNAQIIAAYSATGDYVVGDPTTDNGAVELDVLNYWRQQGIAGHKIDAYASFDSHSQECARQAISLFGGVYIGLSLPLFAQQQDVWDVPSLWSRLRGQDAPGSWGGHAVPILAYDADGLTCITWGARKRMTWAFFAQYCDEAYAPLSHDWLNAQGIDPSGVDFAQLQSDLTAVSSEENQPAHTNP
ncbi:MAG: hypothetical protein WAN33_03910 [Candidatus Acidiferrales bacterium]